VTETPRNDARPTVLVTGSTGLIGSRLCRALGERYCVIGLDRDPPDRDRPAHWIECDLTDDGSFRDAFAEVRELRGERIASAIHLAAHYDFSGEPSPLYEELTVQGTQRLVRGLRSFRTQQLVFSSSLLVLKPLEGVEADALDEDAPLAAEWDYPESKLRAEEVIRAQRDDVPAVILRIAGVYDEDCHSIPLAQQMRRIHERRLESHFFPGDPGHGQAFVHLDDLVDCFAAVVDRRGQLDELETFLVGEPVVVPYGELQDRFGEALHGREWATVRIPAPLAKAGAWLKQKAPGRDPFVKPWMIDLADAHMPVSVERARHKLGWTPKHRLRDTVPEMARRLTADPLGWYAENGLEPPERLREASASGPGARAS